MLTFESDRDCGIRQICSALKKITKSMESIDYFTVQLSNLLSRSVLFSSTAVRTQIFCGSESLASSSQNTWSKRRWWWAFENMNFAWREKCLLLHSNLQLASAWTKIATIWVKKVQAFWYLCKWALQTWARNAWIWGQNSSNSFSKHDHVPAVFQIILAVY